MDAKEPLIRIVLLALLLYAAGCLASTRRELAAAGLYEASLRTELETIEKENLAVSRRLTEGWRAEELEQLARERLGLVLPGDRVFRFTSESREQSPEGAPGEAEVSGLTGRGKNRDREGNPWIGRSAKYLKGK